MTDKKICPNLVTPGSTMTPKFTTTRLLQATPKFMELPILLTRLLFMAMHVFLVTL